jgi:hypothetical protein
MPDDKLRAGIEKALDRAAAGMPVSSVLQRVLREMDEAPKTPVTDILNAIVALGDDEIDFLFQMLDSGMWDEWDCSLTGGIEMGFGSAEIRLAAKSGASTAKWIIEHPNH